MHFLHDSELAIHSSTTSIFWPDGPIRVCFYAAHVYVSNKWHRRSTTTAASSASLRKTVERHVAFWGLERPSMHALEYVAFTLRTLVYDASETSMVLRHLENVEDCLVRLARIRRHPWPASDDRRRQRRGKRGRKQRKGRKRRSSSPRILPDGYRAHTRPGGARATDGGARERSALPQEMRSSRPTGTTNGKRREGGSVRPFVSRRRAVLPFAVSHTVTARWICRECDLRASMVRPTLLDTCVPVSSNYC